MMGPGLIFTPGFSLDRARDDGSSARDDDDGWMKKWVHHDDGWMDEKVQRSEMMMTDGWMKKCEGVR
jgi:hypothetical protein